MTYEGLVVFLCLLSCSFPVFTSQKPTSDKTVYGRRNSLMNIKVPVPFKVKTWVPVLPCNKETRVCITEADNYVVLQGTLTKNQSYMLYNGTGGVDTGPILPLNRVTVSPLEFMDLSSKSAESLFEEFKRPNEVPNFECILGLWVRLFKSLAQDFAVQVWWDGCE
nr:unnamed protein product [Spirometra erinaceieuropaei]